MCRQVVVVWVRGGSVDWLYGKVVLVFAGGGSVGSCGSVVRLR